MSKTSLHVVAVRFPFTGMTGPGHLSLLRLLRNVEGVQGVHWQKSTNLNGKHNFILFSKPCEVEFMEFVFVFFKKKEKQEREKMKKNVE